MKASIGIKQALDLEEMAGKRLVKSFASFAGWAMLVWTTFCLFQTSVSYLEGSTASKQSAFSSFKTECLADEGVVRHENTLLSYNVYCSKKNGNETIFYHKNPESFLLLMTSNVSLGLFDIESFPEHVKKELSLIRDE